MSHLRKSCEDNGRQHIYFTFDELPPSLNHQYAHTKKGTFLKKEVLDFRKLIMVSMGKKRFEWKPTGVTAALILFQSPLWLTKERKVRSMDSDNKIKPLMDAIQEASGHSDENYWEFHVFKVASDKTRTSVFLFDLGDVVEFYY